MLITKTKQNPKTCGTSTPQNTTQQQKRELIIDLITNLKESPENYVE